MDARERGSGDHWPGLASSQTYTSKDLARSLSIDYKVHSLARRPDGNIFGMPTSKHE